MFKYLVTPSRSKISQAREDLVDYAEAPERDVQSVLSWLSDKPESRILRRLESPERYESFHDVLAQPILDWRKKYFAEKERLKEERRRREEAESAAREVRRLRLSLAILILLVLVAGGFAWFAFDQRQRARQAADVARLESERRLAATNDAQASREKARATEASLQAREAELAGQTDLSGIWKKAAPCGD